jgi:hypothetical protein
MTTSTTANKIITDCHALLSRNLNFGFCCSKLVYQALTFRSVRKAVLLQHFSFLML